MRLCPERLVRSLRSGPLWVVLLIVTSAPPAHALGYAWNDSLCPTGGNWTGETCWSGGGFPDGTDDTALIRLDEKGAVTILTSSLFNIEVNALWLIENVDLIVKDNMFLVMTRSTSGSDPTLLLNDVLRISSEDFGTSGLVAGTPLDPEAVSTLSIVGKGEIQLGSHGGIQAATRASIEIGGEIEITSSAASTKPTQLSGELHLFGSKIHVLGGPMSIDADVELTSGAFVDILDQFSSGHSEIRLQGTLRGGTVHPGLGVIRVNGGTLANTLIDDGPIELSGNGTFAGTVTLSNGTVVSVLPSQTLDLSGSAQAGPPHLINHGEIRLGTPSSGPATLRIGSSLVDIDGAGQVVMDHIGSSLSTLGGGVLRNGPQHTIRGRGVVQCSIQNEGSIVVDKGPMTLFSNVTGTGGDVVVTGDASSRGRLDIRAGFSTHDLRIAPHGEMTVGNGWSVVASGDWMVETQDETAIVWSPSTQLILNGGGPPQGFETTSEDLGAVSAGFTGNFALLRLVVSQGGTYVLLRDVADNGNRNGGDEAVYVNTLEVQPGATLDLNGYCLYTWNGGVPYRVQAGDGPLFGGGTILDDGSSVTAVDPNTPSPSGLHDVRVEPNPFNPRTVLRFRLDTAAFVTATVHDPRGRHLRTLTSAPWPTGEHELIWDGRDDDGRRLASGVYTVRVAAGEAQSVRRVTLLK